MVYLELFHGRASPTEDMDDWGEQGPAIGPVDHVHITYLSGTVQLLLDDALEFLPLYGDLVYFDGMFYGDITISSIPPRDGVECISLAEADLPRHERVLKELYGTHGCVDNSKPVEETGRDGKA